jgi:multidrug efflux pump subunit AcrB
VAVLTVQFKVGVPRTEALVRLYDVLNANQDWLPPGLGVMTPIVKPKGIDGVPVLAATLWTKDAASALDLERVAHSVESELKRVPGRREVVTIGGPGRAVHVWLEPNRLRERGVSVQALHGAIAAANQAMPSGSVANPAAALGESGMLSVQTGEFLQNAKDVGDIVVGVSQGRPIYLREVARVEAGAQLPQHYVWFTPGAADTAHVDQQGQSHPAVTITATKKPGENAVDVAAGVRERLDALRNTVIPEDVEVSITRDHGQTAADKANKLIQKLIFATGSVIILVGLALGRREAIIVAAAVILTLTATLFASWAWGFTLNRVSLFALIFSIGILVDDAIVVVENIHRHRSLTPDEPLSVLIPRALDEVGGPTILATFTVIAALLPMAFVSGLMGPYMSPIPINASMGMAISLVIAFTVTPWLALKLTKPNGHAAHGPSKITKSLQGFFARVLTSLLASAKKRWLLLAGILIALLLSVGLAVVQWVVLKKLPFDNKSEYQVVLDMPAGTPLEDTAAALQDMTAFLAQQPELSNVQGYAGTASPITFNGLVRQYCLRAEAESGDLQVNLVDAHQRSEKSHAIAQRHRPELEKIAAVHGARQGGGSAARPARALAHRGRGLWAR